MITYIHVFDLTETLFKENINISVISVFFTSFFLTPIKHKGKTIYEISSFNSKNIYFSFVFV